MPKFFAQTLLIALLVWLSHFFLPWWGMVFPAALVGFLLAPKEDKRRFSNRKAEKQGSSFAAGWIGGSIAWGLPAFLFNLQNEGILGRRIAELIVGSPNFYLMILVSATIAGIVCGFAALTGKLLRLAWLGRK